MKQEGRRLGRGLEALLGRHDAPAGTAPTPTTPTFDSPLREIAVADIRPNPYQPRTEFRSEDIDELKESLAQNGLLQPITVRPAGAGFELIAGERRLRAAMALGWQQISAIVKSIDDKAALTFALVENLQRADLNPIEEAEGYQRLADDFHLSHGEIAQAVGKARTTIVNSLRLLGLPERVQVLMRTKGISAGHGRAILGLPGEEERISAALTVVSKQLSVRGIEEYVKQRTAELKEAEREVERQAAAPELLDADAPRHTDLRHAQVRRIEDKLRAYLQTDVRVDLSGPESGHVSIRFYSSDDLDRVLERIVGPLDSVDSVDSDEAR
ncbi:MAG TPA: ParB/RepB/Spo0J family partition protein [Gemmatimonadaceae bacterium]|nr:ParB/RepB/Spo0J family partition protein [Gemmatimonadaceae bacterium]